MLADYIDSLAIQMNSCRKTLADKAVWWIKRWRIKRVTTRFQAMVNTDLDNA